MTSFLGPDFYFHTPHRAMGSETEYTVQAERLQDLRNYSAIDPYILCENMGNDLWLSNGGRLYYDMDDAPSPLSILEFATPECMSAEEVMRYEKAGELLVTSLASEIVGKNVAQPVYKRSAYTKVRDAYGEVIMRPNSVGHHENYSTPLDEFSKRQILSYVATRSLWAGAGIVTNRGFELSQKGRAVNYDAEEYQIVDHGKKTPLRFRGDYVEIRAGDGNMSPWAIRTKYAMTSLVLRLIEHDEFPDVDIIDDLQSAAKSASRDPRAEFATTRSAVSHQTHIATAAYRFAELNEVPAEERQAARDVLAVCQTMQNDEPMTRVAESLADRVDWAAKLTYIRQQTGIQGLHLCDFTNHSLRVVQHDLLWEALGSDNPSTHWYNKRQNTTDPAAIAMALTQPPASRALLRSEVMERHGEVIDIASWTSLASYGPDFSFKFPSPYLSGTET